MTFRKVIKRILLIAVLILIIGLLPYRLAYFAMTKNMLLVEPQRCGCPCPDISVLKDSIIIPEKFLRMCDHINNTEANLQNGDVIYNTSCCGESYKYYISGEVVGIDTIECNEMGCLMAPVISIDQCYLTTYLPFVLSNKMGYDVYLICTWVGAFFVAIGSVLALFIERILRH